MGFQFITITWMAISSHKKVGEELTFQVFQLKGKLFSISKLLQHCFTTTIPMWSLLKHTRIHLFSLLVQILIIVLFEQVGQTPAKLLLYDFEDDHRCYVSYEVIFTLLCLAKLTERTYQYFLNETTTRVIYWKYIKI